MTLPGFRDTCRDETRKKEPMGRPPIGKTAMTGAERQQRRRAILTAKLVMLDDENTLVEMQRRYAAVPELYKLLREMRQQLQARRRALDSPPPMPLKCRWCDKRFATQHTVTGVRGGKKIGLKEHIEEAHSAEFAQIFDAIHAEPLHEPNAHTPQTPWEVLNDDQPDVDEVGGRPRSYRSAG